MNKKTSTGRMGEDIAQGFLMKNGYKIIERNYWKPWGELDIVALSPDKTLVFIEVKTINSSINSHITAENNLTQSKLKKLQRTASLYANGNPSLVDDNKGWRIDLLAIDIYETGPCPEPSRRVDIRHYENI